MKAVVKCWEGSKPVWLVVRDGIVVACCTSPEAAAAAMRLLES